MKKYLCFIGLLCWGGVVCAQTPVYPPSSSASDAVAAPPSSIDLLKRSLGTSNVTGTSAGVQPASAAKAPSASSPAASAPAAKTGPTQSAPAKSAPKAAQPARKAAQGNYLEMPLSSGAVVKTQVPAAQKTAKTKRKAAPKAAAKKESSPKPTATEKAIEENNALTAPSSAASSASASLTREEAAQDAVAQEELDYAARMLEQARRETAAAGRFIPPSAVKTAQETAVPAVPSNRPYNPQDYRPGVEWQRKDSTHFIIYTQKRDGGIGSSNMGMTFESAYATLRRNIPWMMSDKVRVFVYQDHNSYLKHEPSAKAWTRALAYPTRGEIVVYDEPGKQQELKEVFTHELVHIFTQKFFDKYKTNRLMTPTWLDEGLAVYMEDQAYNGLKGGPWNNDLKTLNFQRSKESQPASFASANMFGSSRGFSSVSRKKGKPVYFLPFDEFMEEGSLSSMEGRGKTQDWYFQAYAMVRFLLNPAGGSSPSNRMQFEQMTRLMAQGEQVRDPSTGFPARDKNGKPVYRPYSAEKAMGKAYRYNSPANFEDAFWKWANNVR